MRRGGPVYAEEPTDDAAARAWNAGSSPAQETPVNPDAAPSTRRAWVWFGVAAAAYFMAIVHRTALGVAGVEALDRFGVGSLQLAALSVVQIGAYAALQIPAGRLLDRFGPRAVIAVGSLVMGAGQLVMAVSDSYTLALAGRLLIGAGDAPIFIAACALVARLFTPRRAPLMVQITAQTGQAGQIATAIPIAWLLHSQGWSVSFATLAAIGVAVAVVAGWQLPRRTGRDAQAVAPEATAEVSPPARGRTPMPAGVRLGFWTHFVSLFSSNTLALLWGVPFFVTAQGRSTAEASLLLTALTLTKIATGPVVGALTARHPLRRSWMVLGSAAATAAAWIALLAPGTPRPLWQLVGFMMVVGAGGPVAVIALDYARTFAPRDRLGTATGFANIGGFASSIAGVLLVGLGLEAAGRLRLGDYTLDAYRFAFALLALPWLVGVVGVLRNRARARADWAASGVVVPPVRVAVRRYMPWL